MAFTFNGTTPTAIKYNGTDITVLKYSKGGTTTAVWGKPFSLSITQGANTTVTVSRTSSPNQHASTGALSSGAVVYYGDILTISASANSGYNLSAFTVNGTAWTSGNTITVTSAITVVTTAQSAVSWKTVWTGNITNTSTSLSASAWATVDGWFNILSDVVPSTAQNVRVTGNITLKVQTKSNSFVLNSTEIAIDDTTSIGKVTWTSGKSSATGEISLSCTGTPYVIKTYAKLTNVTSNVRKLTASVTLTKVEVYY